MSAPDLPAAVAAVAETLPRGWFVERLAGSWRICRGHTRHGEITADGKVMVWTPTPKVLIPWAAEHGHPLGGW